MIKMHSGFVIVGSAVLSMVTAIAGIACYPWGLNDIQSGAGFFTVSFYFFLQALARALNIHFGEGDAQNILEDLFKGVNQLLAMTMIIINAVPHPQFTGILLWSGVAFLFLYAAVKNLWEIGLFVWEEIQDYRESRVEIKRRLQVEIEVTKAMQAEETRIAEEAKVEKDLLSDLAGFLGDTDSSGPSTRGDVG